MAAATLLTESQQRDVCAILSVGGSRALAATYVGCTTQSIAQTAQEDVDFAARLEQAKSAAEISLLKSLLTAAKEPKNWRAAAWALERLRPDRYAKQGTLPLNREQAAELLTEFADSVLMDLTDKQRAKVLKRVEQTLAALQAKAAE